MACTTTWEDVQTTAPSRRSQRKVATISDPDISPLAMLSKLRAPLTVAWAITRKTRTSAPGPCGTFSE
eukprot:CAMPEP_0197691100 /NCGR_PEP_ID=MMETSP1338-20131121/109255_1 /TAXON_ID=43686 ORGANISM="Pelagodinium beii, Strain RCC1491" /NCGR_SAMPLE_ID=MMETSP1338 /ASSEMBLY_ACC=CAM_ASM_000754 /LENGTH=67 /DNA_ID=CAMNT_0043273611 /DNA_START=615 /DNA_END=818 /DNA_ORIENTATION=+